MSPKSITDLRLIKKQNKTLSYGGGPPQPNVQRTMRLAFVDKSLCCGGAVLCTVGCGDALAFPTQCQHQP